ncbi:hypothetical protein QOZ80_4BG0353550 [Eleusine coracana subsp. coracana]|nr:hypothetical protein QOZ80_4BG0353550 [Eleusine coracana subsp. coracana]
MASSGDPRADSRKQLRVLLPFSFDSLRIPDKLAEDIRSAQEALVVGKVKVWNVEVERDGDGAFLGRGWPEFASSCGVGAGWLVVVRHRGRGMLTVKAFDDSGCYVRELGAPPPAAETAKCRKDDSPRPQFIHVLPLNHTEKMLIPSKFVQNYMNEERLNCHATIILAPLGKVGQVELEMNQSDVFLAVKIFEPDGVQMEFKQKDVRMQQNTAEQQRTLLTASFKKIHKNNLQSSDWKKNRKGSITCFDKASLQRKCVYNIGPPSWIKKLISAKMVKRYIVRLHPYKNTGHQFGSGWRMLCRENRIREGDICTFNIIETTLWHVDIERQ